MHPWSCSKPTNARLRFPFGMAVCLALLARCPFAPAAEFSPRVLSPHTADAYSMKTFAAFHRWQHLQGDAKAWEVFRYLADPRTGLFPLGTHVEEGSDAMPEFRLIRDPVKLINVYGYGFCGILGPTMAGVCQEMGLGPSRTLTLPGWNHVVAETQYDGKWHYLDLDVRAAFRRPDGTLASMEDAKRDPSVWSAQGPLFFPLDPIDRVREVYARTPVGHLHGFHFSGHTMDYVLRQGEQFMRWWKPQGGRWQHLEVYHREPFFRQLLSQSPGGPRCKHAGWSIHTHGNGRFLYRPNLTNRSSDFDDGAYDHSNVRPGPNGLTLVNPGSGYVVFEIRSPYVIVPLVGEMQSRVDDREASVVRLQGSGIRAAISTDNGLTYQGLGDDFGVRDLTKYVSGRYGYLLRIALAGSPDEAVLRSLEITTWVQVAPASLPSLRRGLNRMSYVAGDHYGLPTRVMEIRTLGGGPEEFTKYLHQPPADMDWTRSSARVKGTFVVRVTAPPHTRIAWLSAGANFTTHQHEAARQTRNSIAYAAEQPVGFQEIYRADVPADNDHWHYNADREVRLPSPARVVYLKYVGDPAVNNLRVYAHCLEDRPRPRSDVMITHGWKENGAMRTKSTKVTGSGVYDVVTEADPEDEFLELSVPSGARG